MLPYIKILHPKRVIHRIPVEQNFTAERNAGDQVNNNQTDYDCQVYEIGSLKIIAAIDRNAL